MENFVGIPDSCVFLFSNLVEREREISDDKNCFFTQQARRLYIFFISGGGTEREPLPLTMGCDHL